jgi:hypothetical protein
MNMKNKASQIIWTISGSAWWLYSLFLLTDLFFSEAISNIAIKNGSFTFFGWSMVGFAIALTWLMIWRMLKEIHCRTTISIFLALIIAVCMGFMEIMTLTPEWFWQILN